jgi:hypothetical protein
METTVSLADLRGLARLYRGGVEGAHEQLCGVIEHSSDALPDVIGFPHANVERLRRSDDPVELLVVTIEAGLRGARENRNAAQKRAARDLAAALGQSSMCEDGSVRLPVRWLRDLATTWPGSGMLVFGERGGVGIPGLRAFLRECRRIDDIHAVLTSDALILRYCMSRSRGQVRLGLHPVRDGDDVLAVALPASTPAVDVEPVVTPVPQQPCSREGRRRRATTAATVAVRLVEAIAALVGAGW